VTDTARLAKATDPIKFDEFMFEIAEPFPLNSPAPNNPDTAKELNVPTDVILGWEFPDTAVASIERATVPEILDEFIFVIP
jgi:hypothetical protein